MSTAKSKALKKYENSKVDEYLDRETKVKEDMSSKIRSEPQREMRLWTQLNPHILMKKSIRLTGLRSSGRMLGYS